MRLMPISLLLVASIAAVAPAAPPRYLAAREIVLECPAANSVEVSAIDLWVSTDHRQTWQKVAAVQTGPAGLRYTAPADGHYDLYLVLRNEAGTSGPPPDDGTESAAVVVVDTAAPLIQLHEAELRFADDVRTLRIRASLADENLSDGGIRVFYRTNSEEWIDGGPTTRASNRPPSQGGPQGRAKPADVRSHPPLPPPSEGGECRGEPVPGDSLLWTPPDTADTALDLRIVVTDLAGNRATDELLSVPLQAPVTVAPEASSLASATPPGAVAPVLPPRVTPVEPPVVRPISTAGTTPPNQSPVDASATQTSNLDHLRELASRFMREGKYPLAAARLEDALQLAPADAELLVDSGSALYRLGRYDNAQQRFQSALDTRPEHAGALNGLALVAATQKRYPQAREHLRHLHRLQPDSGVVWLRLGDVEQQLGNRSAALQAWEEALEAADADATLKAKAQRRLQYFRRDAYSGEPERQTTDGTGSEHTFDGRGVRR